MKDPILAQRSIPSGRKYNLTMKVVGGLQYLRGNAAPYFSLTVDIHRKGFPNQCQSGGCDHETILKYYPRFADLAAMHLSDIDGVPMHAEANGWYWMAGAASDHFGEKYHGGKDKTPEQSLQVFANHARVSLGVAAALLADLEGMDSWNEARRVFAGWIEAQKPRWATEAKACIERHKLKVFGDDWGGVK